MATRRTAAQAETPSDDPPADPPAPVGDPDGSPAAGGVEDDHLREVVRDVVAEMLGDRQDASPAGGGGATPGTQRAAEDDMTGRVTQALQRIRGDEEKDARLKKLEEKVLTELPPVRQRISTRMMWGN